jgi:hypothetical protein
MIISPLASKVKPTVAQAVGHDSFDAHLKGGLAELGNFDTVEVRSSSLHVPAIFSLLTYAQLPSPLLPLERETFTLAQSRAYGREDKSPLSEL